MHGFPISLQAIVGGLLAGQLLVLFAFLQTYLLKVKGVRGHGKMVLDGLSLLMGALGVLTVLLFAAVALAFTQGAPRVHAVFAFLAVGSATVAWIGRLADRRSSGHVPVSWGGLVAIGFGIAAAIANVIALVAAAAAWAVA